MKIDPAALLATAADALAMPPPAPRPRVLVVDDTPANLTLMANLLSPLYQVQLATSGAKALELVRRQTPDLVVLDVMMPEMDGHEVCRRLKADPAVSHVPVLFLTALSRPEDEIQAFAAGGADFIQKPFNPVTVLSRVATQLQVKAWQDALRDRNAWLQQELKSRIQEVDELRDATLFVMVSFAEFRDEETGNHVRRTQEYVRTLATWLQDTGDARYELAPDEIDAIAKSAPLHDIGKVAIPDGILLKPGRLTPEEFVIMKTHALRGWELLNRAAQRMGEEGRRYLRHAMDIARHHHERWDGSGYPDGLVGDAIPLSARLMAVADVYDALISRRPYKGPIDPDEALRMVGAGAGGQFDPMVVMAMQATVGQIAEIAARWGD